MADVVARARALLEAADPRGDLSVSLTDVDGGRGYSIHEPPRPGDGCDAVEIAVAWHEDVAALIAAAPTLIAELADEVERLRRAVFVQGGL